MTCSVIGPGLVGSFLGIAAGATRVVCGQRRRIAAHRAELPNGNAEWRPAVTSHATGPTLVACRVPDTPHTLPAIHLRCQNGIEDGPAIACFFAIDRRADGSITWTGPTPRIVVGPLASCWHPVLANWRAHGLIVEEVADVRPARWEKAILNATVGPLCLATGLDMAAVWADRELRQAVRAATAEGIAIAHDHGIAVDATLVDRAEQFFNAVGSHRPSLLDDARELPCVLDVLLTAAARVDRATPALQAIHARCQRALALVG